MVWLSNLVLLSTAVVPCISQNAQLAPSELHDVHVASLGAAGNEVVSCRQDRSANSSHDFVCNVIRHTGSSLEKGPPLIRQVSGTVDLAVAALSRSTAALCWTLDGDSSIRSSSCVLLAVSGMSLSADFGNQVSIEAPDPSSAVEKMALRSSRAAGKAVLCQFLRASDSWNLLCYAMRVQGSELTLGTMTTVASGQTDASSEATFGELVEMLSSAGDLLICWSPAHNRVACRGATFSGTSLLLGAPAQDLITTTAELTHWRAAHLADGEVLICGEQWLHELLYCYVVSGSAALLSAGPEFQLSDNMNGYAIEHVEANKALLCYETKTWRPELETKCGILTSQQSTLSGEVHTLLAGGEVSEDIDMAPVSGGFIACYDYSTGIYIGDPWGSTCTMIRVEGDELGIAVPPPTSTSSALGQSPRWLPWLWLAAGAAAAGR